MSKYIVKAEAGTDCNPEYAPDLDIIGGFECDGYMILGFVDGKPKMETIMGASIGVLSKWLMNGSAGANIMRQACAIAEGQIRAMEIGREETKAPQVGFAELKMDGKLSYEDLKKIFGNSTKWAGNGI